MSSTEREEVYNVNTKLINPYDVEKVGWRYRVYRDRPEEQFANWFSGVMTQPKKTKEMSPTFFKWFGQENKKLFSDLANVDKKTLGPFMSKKGFTLFEGF